LNKLFLFEFTRKQCNKTKTKTKIVQPKWGPVEFSTTSPGKKYRNPEIFPGKRTTQVFVNPPPFYGFRFLIVLFSTNANANFSLKLV
jgi:hypothetical protein